MPVNSVKYSGKRLAMTRLSHLDRCAIRFKGGAAIEPASRPSLLDTLLTTGPLGNYLPEPTELTVLAIHALHMYPAGFATADPWRRVCSAQVVSGRADDYSREAEYRHGRQHPLPETSNRLRFVRTTYRIPQYDGIGCEDLSHHMNVIGTNLGPTTYLDCAPVRAGNAVTARESPDRVAPTIEAGA